MHAQMTWRGDLAGAHGPGHLEARIEAFIKGFEDTLDSMPPEEWEQHREALIQAKKQKDASIADEAMRFWEQLASRRCGCVIAALLLSLVWPSRRSQGHPVLPALSCALLGLWRSVHLSSLV